MEDRNALKVKGARAAGDREPFLFDPDAFDEQHKPLKVNDYKLSEKEVLEYGVLVTRLREQFTVRATALYREHV